MMSLLFRITALLCVGLACAGCGEYVLPAVNCEPPPAPIRTQIEKSDTALLASEEGVGDALWLQIDRQRPPDADSSGSSGAIGGYLSTEQDHRDSLVLLLTGASTYHVGGKRETTLDFFRRYAGHFREEGFAVWSVALREDTAYGQGEVSDLLEVLDWLDREGKAFLKVERVYLVGYSTGAIATNFANLKRDVTAAVSMGGLTESKQLEEQFFFYHQFTNLFPCNTGMSQMRLTLDTYSVQGWDAFNVVSRVAQIRNPTLFVHIESDAVFFSSNTHDMERAYQAQLAAGNTSIPELSFLYIAEGSHLDYVLLPSLAAPVVAYLKTFEP